MKFGVLALDYDGTIARDGVLDAEVRKAIAEVRSRGIAVLIVTGRILSELEQVAGDLGFVDGVVAENGAVLWFPNGHSRLVSSSSSLPLMQELSRRGMQFKAGQCVVELDAAAAPQVLSVIRDLELPLVLLFNRGRLMVLPQAVSKGMGLREALATLRLSVHNALAIGDAENDHDLLATCELGVAVSWGSQILQKVADEVLHGDGPTAVAGYIRRVARDLRLPPEQIGQHRLSLGTAQDGHELTLALRGRNMLIAGDPRSGKSWVTGLACEQLILQGYSVFVIDPEGDYRTLEGLPGVVVFGGDDPPPELPVLARVLRHPDMSVVMDLSHAPYQEKVNYLKSLLPMLVAIRRATGLPHRIVIDEAHYFLHEPNVNELLDLTLGAYTLVTYRMSDLHPNLRRAMEGVIIKRTTDPREIQALTDILAARGIGADSTAVLSSLGMEEAVLLPGIEESGNKLLRFTLFPRLTSHVRHKAKYLDVQLLAEQGFWFVDQGVVLDGPARTLKEFVALLAKAPASVVAEHAHRGDFSNWIGGVFHDHALASDVRKVEQRFRIGHIHDLSEAIAKLIKERYEFSAEQIPEPAINSSASAPGPEGVRAARIGNSG
ncbi:MAG: HAD hydrolase family protein [Acidobacteriia bacterium]|nr:HAD hydrolase family protein [Terriglobia bacterium]